MAVNLRNQTLISGINVSKRAFWSKPLGELLNQDKCVQSPFTMAESRFSPDECFTTGIITCVAGIIKAVNAKEFFMFHINPRKEENHWSLLHRKLDGVLDGMRQKGGNTFEGFLYGADASDAESMGLADNFIGYFRENKINSSALLGQKDQSGASLYCSLPDREITLSFAEADKINDFSGLKKSFSRVILGIHNFKFGGAS